MKIKGGFDTLNTILKPFLQVVRQPPYLKKDEYKHLIENNYQIYLSSAWYSDHWSFDHYMDYVNKMLKGDSYFTCNFPYQLANYHSLMPDTRVKEILEDPNMTNVAFQMEYEALFYRLNDKAYIKSSDIIPCRTIEKAWYPPNDIKYVEEKDKKIEKRSYHIAKESKEELRVLSCDIAIMGSSSKKNNDASIFTYFRCIPKNEKYIADVLHTESWEGEKANSQALRIKRLFYDGQVDYCVLDCLGIGGTVLDALGEYTFDKDRDITYPPMKCFNEKDLEERCGYKEALPVIYGFRGSAKLNSDMATMLKASLQHKAIRLLVGEIEAEDYLVMHKKFKKLSPDEQAELLLPYVQVTLMQNEIIGLEASVGDSGYLKITETGRSRKDRYTSLAMGNYFIRQKQLELRKPKRSAYLPCLW